MPFLVLTLVEETATKIVLNTEYVVMARRYIGQAGTFLEAGKTEIELHNGNQLIVRETPLAIIAAVAAVTP